MKKMYNLAAGAVAGFVAGIFGVGGGIFALPLLKKGGMDIKKSHAASVAIVLAITIPATVISVVREPAILEKSLAFLPGTVAGGLLAAIFLAKLPQHIIRIVFGVLLILSAVRIFF